jgi:GNAT superfamily N-acetyltransferase
MQIIKAKPEDAPALTRIAVSSKRHWGYPKSWIQSWLNVLTITPEFIRDNETHVAMVEVQAIGFYALGLNGDRLDLLHLWVLPRGMGRGVGRALFVHAVDRTREMGFRALEIESDPNAAGFYQRMGAHRIGSRVQEIEGKPRELPVFLYDVGV